MKPLCDRLAAGEIRRGLAASAALLLSPSVIAVVAFGVVAGLHDPEVAGLAASAAILAALQTAISWWLGLRLERRLAGLVLVDRDTAVDALRAFPSTVIHATVGAVAVAGPVLLVCASALLGAGPGALLVRGGLCLLVVGLSSSLLVHTAAGTAIRPTLDGFTGGTPHAPKGRSVVARLLPLLVVPSLAAALGAAVAAERTVGREREERTAACVREVVSAVVASGPFSPGIDPADVVARLTRFDEAVPLIARPADDPGSRLVIEPLEGTSLRVGVRLSPAGDPRSVFFVVATLLAAGFGATLVAVWIASRLRGQIAGLADRMNALPANPGPHGDRPGPGCLASLDEAIGRLGDRFLEMRRSQEKALAAGREARGLKARFFASMSHDLRSPLNSIVGFSDLLLRDAEGALAARPRAAVAFIAEKAEWLLLLIREILDTAGLEAGQFEMDRAWVPSVEILTDCVASARRLVGTREIEVAAEIQPGLPPVHVDKDRVRQALMSLLSRAVASMDRGIVRLKAAREQEPDAPARLRVDIVDTGRAIPPEDRERIFEAFHASGTDGGRMGSMNLSLSLARNIIRLHGGDVVVESQEGRGSIFTVTLPLEDDGSRTEWRTMGVREDRT